MAHEPLREIFKQYLSSEQYRDYTFVLFQEGEVIAVLEKRELVSRFGEYKMDHIEKAEEKTTTRLFHLPVIHTDRTLAVYVIPPNIRWYPDLEYVGFTDITSPGSEMVEGFFTFCVGYSQETGYIYVDVGYSEKDDRYQILSPDRDHPGRGFQDIPIRIPQTTKELLLTISRQKREQFYEKSEHSPDFED